MSVNCSSVEIVPKKLFNMNNTVSSFFFAGYSGSRTAARFLFLLSPVDSIYIINSFF